IARSMLSLGIDASLALRTAFSSVAFALGSPPPARGAAMIARASVENCAPRRESTTAFLCLMLDHFECPDISGVYELAPRRIACRVSASPSPDIFKAYDIRGLYPEQIDSELAERIGHAFAVVLSSLSGKSTADLRIGLGRDMRLSASELAGRYAAGLLRAGAAVSDIGEVGTEMLYYLVGSRGLDGGLMCTASHNPKAYTGAKLVREGALALSGDAGIQDVRRTIEAGIPDRGARRRGTLQELDPYEDFQAAALG